MRFIDLAEQINIAQPAYTASRIAAVLNQQRLPVYGTEILGVGIAYKPNIADDRESASIDVLRRLEESGAIVSVLDPVVGTERIEHHGFRPVTTDDDLSRFAVAVILTDHDDIDYGAISASVPVVFDAKGAYRRRGISADNVVVL